MKQIFETHAHYNDHAFDCDRDDLVAAIRAAGISPVAEIGSSLETSRWALQLAHSYEDHYAVVGVHPSDIACLEETAGEETAGKETVSEETVSGAGLDDFQTAASKETWNDRHPGLAELRAMCADPKVIAVGEIGLDYYWEKDPQVQERQKYWFWQQLALARDADLPVVIHSRDAAADTMNILKEATALGNHGVVHCYSYSPEQAAEYVKMGWYIGVGGVVTFKNGRKLTETVRQIPIERILLETDSPYLSPEPNRGRRNDSRNLHFIAQKVAELKGLTKEDVVRITTENARKCYGI